MARTETPPEVVAYLRELDSALAGVAPDLAEEIRGGVAEELMLLSPDEARVRIAQLGDARFIAAEAGAQGESETSVLTGRSVLASRTYAIVAAVALAVGAFVVPLVGWAFGYVLVCLSPVWRRWEKALAVSGPLALTVLVAGLFALVGYPSAASGGGSPWLTLLPTVLSNAAIILAVSNAVAGVGLLARGIVRS